MKTRFTDEQIIQMINGAGSWRKDGLIETPLGLWAKLESWAKAGSTLEEWQEDYDTHRPHSVPGNLTPREFAEKRTIDKLAA